MQMKVHSFDTSYPVSIIGFLNKLKLACDATQTETIKKQKSRTLHFFENNVLVTTFSSCKLAAIHIAPVAASVNIVKPTTEKMFFGFYP